jgi:hypothetical protein
MVTGARLDAAQINGPDKGGSAMRRRITLIIVLTSQTFAPISVGAKDKTPYSPAKLADLRRFPTHAGAFKAQAEFCLAIELDGISYLAHYAPVDRGAYMPTDLFVGDDVMVKIKGNNLVFRSGKPRDEVGEAEIIRRQRITPDNPAATCSDPVSIR